MIARRSELSHNRNDFFFSFATLANDDVGTSHFYDPMRRFGVILNFPRLSTAIVERNEFAVLVFFSPPTLRAACNYSKNLSSRVRRCARQTIFSVLFAESVFAKIAGRIIKYLVSHLNSCSISSIIACFHSEPLLESSIGWRARKTKIIHS